MAVIMSGQEILDGQPPQDHYKHPNKTKKRFWHRHPPKLGPRSMPSLHHGDSNYRPPPAWAQHFFENLVRCIQQVYDGATGFSGSKGARFTQLGLGLFSLFFFAFYSSNLTAVLVNQHSSITTWAEARQRGVRVCGTTSSRAVAEELYPVVNWHPKTTTNMTNNHTAVLEALAMGDCDAAIVDLSDLQVQHG